MSDHRAPNPAIYIASNKNESFHPVSRTSFTAQGVSEVSGLQNWVRQNPSVLGEELLVLTCEYDGFDRSRKRLDILALDQDAKLVVIELKLDTTGHFADLQAINYAAMVSTMLMTDGVRLLAKYRGVSTDDARGIMAEFLDCSVDHLPDLDDKPRIIIAAGNFGGLEITSTSLWLRTFGVDIKLVEIAPYANDDGDLILVPRIVIPIPEAAEYMVGHEKKEEAQRQRGDDSKAARRTFLDMVVAEFKTLAGDHSLGLDGGNVHRSIRHHAFSMPEFGRDFNDLHCEWVFEDDALKVGLHFERALRDGGKKWNASASEYLLQSLSNSDLVTGIDVTWLKKANNWHWIGTKVAEEVQASDLQGELVQDAARAMLELIKAARPLIPAALSFADDKLQEAGSPEVQ